MIKEKIELLISKLKGDEKVIYDNLWSDIKGFVNDVNAHNKIIIAQMHDYDIHDKAHSDIVLHNIENFLSKKGLERLSLYELILIYSSCYFHDAGMALASWEYKLLRAAEGTDSCFDNTLDARICNDFKPVQTHAKIVEFIKQNKQKLYGFFSTASGFVFCEKSEDDLINDLAKRVASYEQFRNGYTDELKEKITDTASFFDYSCLLRSEFIRITHADRIAEYLVNIKNKFAKKNNRNAVNNYTRDIAEICKAHGKNNEFIQNLSAESHLVASNSANLQFVALLLRIGDILHFTSDRAPFSLFAEKRITNAESLKHWRAKFSDVRLSFDVTKNIKTIKFSAYCDEPPEYYFLHNYIDYIDDELENYNRFIDRMRRCNNSKDYDFKVHLKVDRTLVQANLSNFIPEHNMKFTLEQAKIIKLLMGVQLYKDQFSCLRELYQNALDTCKSVVAANEKNGISEEVFIEFGLDKNSKGETYIYCLDKGYGMTKQIIKDYLLKIGNSYYKSKDFSRKNSEWGSKVAATSQFGIGILSCYMLANRIEITTRYYENSNKYLSFSLDGPNEQFYYTNPEKTDCDKIGLHGTIVKLVLKPEIESQINNEVFDDLKFLIYAHKGDIKDKAFEALVSKFKNSLFYLINRQIRVPNESIGVTVVFCDGSKQKLIRNNEYIMFDELSAFNKDLLEQKWKGYWYFDGYPNPYKKAITNFENVVFYTIKINKDGVELYTLLVLPKKSFSDFADGIKIVGFYKFVWPSESIYVDGISIRKERDELSGLLGRYIWSNCQINFTGEKRPILSVDRTQITEIPNDAKNAIAELPILLIKEIVSLTKKHFVDEQIEFRSPIAGFIFEILRKNYPEHMNLIFEELSNVGLDALYIDDLSAECAGCNTINGIIAQNEVVLKNMDFRYKLFSTQELLIRKMFNASCIEINGVDIKIISDGFFTGENFAKHSSALFSNNLTYIVKVDKAQNCFEEYDLITSLFPLVPDRLFNKFNEELESGKNESLRAKPIEQYSNNIWGICTIDPLLVNPKFGISSKEKIDREKSCFNKAYRIENEYWLPGINNWELQNQKINYVLFAYISSRELNDYEKKEKSAFSGDDEYIKGIENGWSVLFLGHAKRYYILPGKVKRSDIINLVPKNIINNDEEIVYYNLDGTKTFK